MSVGLGLRPDHYRDVLRLHPKVPFFEVISDNFMGLKGEGGGRPFEVLEKVRQDYPIFLHGVSMNLGSTDPLNLDYLRRLKKLADRIDAAHVSDHLCWTGVGGENLHDLLPLPYTSDAVSHVAKRIRQAQDILGRRLLIENVSSYLSYTHSEMSEYEFLIEVAAKADCGLLLDVNNIYVSATNHGFDPADYITAVPINRVQEMHMAGHSVREDGFLIDTHDHPIARPVWDLYKIAVQRFGNVPTIIERDDNIPRFQELMKEARRASSFSRDSSPRRTGGRVGRGINGYSL